MWNSMKRKRSVRNRRARRCLFLILLALLALLLIWPRTVHLEGLVSPYAILVDADSGEAVAEKEADVSIYPASMTKVMTALLALEANPDLEQPVTMPEDIFPELRAEGASMAGFRPGETATVRDMARLLRAAMQNETFRAILSAGRYAVPATDLHPEGFTMTSTFWAELGDVSLWRGQFLGGKTGYTSAAGLCLASAAQVKGKRYILVTAGAKGNHGTEPYHIEDAVRVYRQLTR